MIMKTSLAILPLLALIVAPAVAQDFPNVARVPGELLAGPIAPEQGRTAIVAWHGGRVVSVPEGPGSQPGAVGYEKLPWMISTDIRVKRYPKPSLRNPTKVSQGQIMPS